MWTRWNLPNHWQSISRTCNHWWYTYISNYLRKFNTLWKYSGIDYHGPSIEEAQKLNECNNVSYKVASASDVSSDSVSYLWINILRAITSFAQDKFDAVTFFDCFHDMSVASEAAKRAFEMTKDNGFVVTSHLLWTICIQLPKLLTMHRFLLNHLQLRLTMSLHSLQSPQHQCKPILDVVLWQLYWRWCV